MKHASLFSGIGGFDLAAEWMGWHNVFHCEVDTFCNKILKYHFPNSISYGNIKETNFTPHKGWVDILTGGFPCQPFSAAGLRNGTKDARYLWPEMFRAIREIRPRWVIAENVRGLLSWNEGLVLDTVCTDLENEGYEVWPFLLPACGVNAPHQRYRIWIIAYCPNSDDWGNTSEQAERQKQQFRNRFEQDIASNTNSERSNRWGPDRNRLSEEETFRSNLFIETDGSCQEWPATDSENAGCETRKERQGQKQFRRGNERTIISTDWRDFPSKSPVCGRDDGVSLGLDGITFPKWRSESIKAYGNAVVPQIPYMLFKNIVDFERTLKLFE